VVPLGLRVRENFGVSDENLERRMTAVEAEVTEIRREAAAARALAAGADRDVADYRAEMRAHTRGLEALRMTQIEHYAEHRSGLEALRMTQIEHYAEHRSGLEALGMTQIEHYAEHKADLADFRAEVNARFNAVEGRFAEVNAGLRVIVGMLEGPGGPATRTAE
jgi:hypothetical protein